MFASIAGIELTSVAYKQISNAMTDLISGQIQVIFVDSAAGDSFVASGQLRALAAQGEKRLAKYPTLPLVSESFASYNPSGFLGVAVPSATPLATKQALNELINEAVSIERVNACSDQPRATAELRDFFAEDDEILAALMRVVIARSRAQALDQLGHDQTMTQIICHLLTCYGEDSDHGAVGASRSQPISLTKATLRRIFAHVDDGLATDLRLAGLAAVAHLSEDHFIRAFRCAVGQTPHQYVVARRLDHAKQLLRHSTLPLAQIALQSGFRTASHFAATFRQHEQTSPSLWRTNQAVRVFS